MKTFEELLKSRNIKECVEFINSGCGTKSERDLIKDIIYEDAIVYQYQGQICVEDGNKHNFKYIEVL